MSDTEAKALPHPEAEAMADLREPLVRLIRAAEMNLKVHTLGTVNELNTAIKQARRSLSSPETP